MEPVDHLLRELIRIPSENPGGNESDIAAYCSDLLISHGLDTVTIQDAPNRPNVICEIDRGRGPTVILQSHLDTKPAAHNGSRLQDWNRDGPFEPYEEDGLLFGLGACDTKGGVAAQLTALLALSKRDGLKGKIIWQGVADEENGSLHGAEMLLKRGLLSADAAIVVEPTSGVPSLEQLGNCWAKIDVRGIAAHGGLPWLGVDAISIALEVVDVMSKMVSGLTRDDRYGSHPYLRIGAIGGGGHAGTVASDCFVVTDIRVRPGEARQRYLDIWAAAIKEVEQRHNRCAISLSLFAGGGCEPHVLDGNEPLATVVRSAWTKLMLTELEPTIFFGGSDARYFKEAGTPAIVLGPGNLAQAHSPNEYAPLNEVRRTAALIDAIVAEICSPKASALE